MPKRKMKKRRLVGRRELVVMILAVIFTSAGIKASDMLTGSKTDEHAFSGPCPPDMVFVNFSSGSFCIDKYEASADGGCPYQSPANQRESRLNLDYGACKPQSKLSALPWRFISQNQAATACAKAGKRLPTNSEWLAAAQGTSDKDAGWGANDCQVANNWPQQPGASGSGADCVSSAGAYDLIGNVWEWVEGTVSEGNFKDKVLPDSGYVLSVDDEALPAETRPDAGDENYYGDYFWIKQKGVRGIARGGYWDNAKNAGQYAMYVVSEPSFAGTGVGFRCVAEARQ